MSSLVEGLSRWVERVEILARGVESERRAAEVALGRDRPLEAREAARVILAKVPDSIVGLALWADAAESAWLDDEACAALERLSEALPWRLDVWQRLGAARARTGRLGAAREAFERAAAPGDFDATSRVARRAALLALADLDLGEGDPARARRWLDRATLPLGGEPDLELELRRGECALELGDRATAEAIAQKAPEPTGEGRPTVRGAAHDASRWVLLHARLALAALKDAPNDAMLGARAIELAIRALTLDAPGAPAHFAAVVAGTRDAARLALLREVAASEGRLGEPRFEAAFALAEGRHVDARGALVRALEAGDARASEALVELALEARDAEALAAVERRAPGQLPSGLAHVLEAVRRLEAGDVGAALARLDDVEAAASPWAHALRLAAARRWLAPEGVAWAEVLGALHREARRLGRLELAVRVESLSVELERPLLLAVVGEFNAGKSSFINALLGGDVAPTGILPTTATLHRVAWAEDRFARVLVSGRPDRVVQHAELKRTLGELGSAGEHVERVLIYAPLERLRKVEILDTPGFNAPDPRHVESARASFDEAHAVVWLLDATSVLKDSEAAILREIAGMGLPIVALVNKLDRLSASDEARALDHAREGLDAIGVRLHAGPVAFSAKRALGGLLGDEAALASSRWREVEALLGAEVVDRSEALRERALLRKAARLAAELAQAAQAAEAEDLAASQAQAARRDALARASAELSRREAELAAELGPRLAEVERALRADLRPVLAVGDAARGDDELRAYAIARLVHRLAPALCGELGRRLEVELSQAVRAGVGAALEAAAWSLDAAELYGARSFERMIGIGVRSAARMLAFELEATARGHGVGARASRLEALAEALRERAAAPGTDQPTSL